MPAREATSSGGKQQQVITLIKIHLVDADEAKVEEMPAYLGVQHWPLPHKFPPFDANPTFDAIKREIWLRSPSLVSSLPFCQQPVVFLPPPRRPSISPSPPEIVGQPGAPAGGEDKEEEGTGGGGTVWEGDIPLPHEEN